MHYEDRKTPKSPTPNQDGAKNSYFAYLSEISQYKVLTADEEIALFEKITAGDDAAKDLFIKCNLRLVVSEAKKYYVPEHNEMLDLIQEGNMGLLRALDGFDPARGCKFSTYAVYHINKAIQRSSCRTGLPLNVPQNALSLINRIRFTVERLEAETGAVPSCSDIATRLNINPEKVKELLPFATPSVSLYSKIGENNDREFIDVFSEQYADSDDIEQTLIANETQEHFRSLLSEALNERELYILCSRYGLFGSPIKTTREMMDILKMTKQGIQQAEQRAAKKLKKYLESLELSIDDLV